MVLVIAIIAVVLIVNDENKPNTEYDINKQVYSVSSQVVASNDNYSLKWDDDGKFVMLESLKTGKVWSNIPYEYYLDGGLSANVNSTINITVADNTTLQWQTVRGYNGAVGDGRVFSELVENGIKITYCFDLFKVSVPVTYILRDDSLLATIDTQGIKEGGEDYTLVSVSLAPFLCSSKNEEENSYLFVPTGSGALMYTNESSVGTRKYSGEVYGHDFSSVIEDPYLYDETIRLPVYGVKSGNNALFAIIEDGAPSAAIEAEAGNSRNGYSTIFSTFYYRGYEEYRTGTYAMGKGLVRKTSEKVCESDFSVGFYPLFDNDANYNGMAKCYKKFLNTSGFNAVTKEKQRSYSVTLLGGTMVTSSVMGVPKKTLKAMTTFSDAKEILKDLNNIIKEKPAVQLKGFGETGIINGKVAGGYVFSSIFGNRNDHSYLENYCKEASIALFTDFDLVRFSKSGEGFSYDGNTAKNPLMKIATLYPTTPIRMNDSDMAYRLLARAQLKNALDKLIGKLPSLNVSAISLSTFGDVAYSDYDSNKYTVKNDIDIDVNKMISSAKASGLPIAVSSANAYSASAADTIFDVPMGNGGYNAFDELIPFYQMVFKGSKPMYSTAVNLADNPDKLVMLAASSGIGLGFTLIDKFDVNFTELTGEELYSMVYSDNKEFIKQTLTNYLEIYNKVCDSSIDTYEILENGISKTVFANGVTVYANHTELNVQSSIGILAPYQFKVEK
jgi:hypothetical protein